MKYVYAALSALAIAALHRAVIYHLTDNESVVMLAAVLVAPALVVFGQTKR